MLLGSAAGGTVCKYLMLGTLRVHFEWVYSDAVEIEDETEVESEVETEVETEID